MGIDSYSKDNFVAAAFANGRRSQRCIIFALAVPVSSLFGLELISAT